MEKRSERRLAAVFSADAVGYSRGVARDEAGTLARMRESRALISQLVAASSGRVVDAIGDNLMAEFSSSLDAVECAIAVQRALGERNAGVSSEARLPFRIGIEAGDVVVDGDRIAGDVVNTAARLETLAPVGGIAISGIVRSQVAGRVDVVFADLGEQRLKNLPTPVRVFRAELGGGEAAEHAIEHNLPLQRTRFIGRERARNELAGLLAGGRLLTLTGLGGAGKTRLAIEVARESAARFEGGVWWVELAALTEPDRVAAAVATAVGAGVGAGGQLMGNRAAPVEEIVSIAAHREVLIVLDNCEQVVDGVAELVDELLGRCDRLSVLATSREPLEVEGERVWQVPPLGLPDGDAVLADAEESEAVALFVERARAARSDFKLSDANLPAVLQICSRLDGIPLALELAAVRVRHLSPGQIAERLDDRFQLLGKRGRRSDRRHQTLQATLDWSHDLLEDAERILLRRLAVFQGSFTLEAAEGVCSGAGLDRGRVLASLGALIDRSLVVGGDTAEVTRYRMLETVREYAAGKLSAADETSMSSRAHMVWFGALCERFNRQLERRGMTSIAWGGVGPEDLGEIENLRVATELAIESGDERQGELGLVTVLLMRACNQARQAIALGGRLDRTTLRPALEDWLVQSIATAHSQLGEFSRAFDLFEEVGSRTDGELGLSAKGQQLVCALAAQKGDLDEMASDIRNRAEQLGGPHHIAYARTQTGALQLIRGELRAALDELAESFTVRSGGASLLLTDGYYLTTAVLLGEEEHARRGAEAIEAHAGLDHWGFHHWDAWGLARPLALYYAWRGERIRAEREYIRGLNWQRARPLPLADADHLVTGAALAFYAGEVESCAILLGAARSALAPYRSWRGHDAGPLYLHFRERCGEVLGEEASSRLRSEGRSFSTAEGLAFARERIAEMPTPSADDCADQA